MKKLMTLLVLIAMLLLVAAVAPVGATPGVNRQVLPIRVTEDGHWTNLLPMTGARSAFMPGLECWNPPMVPTEHAIQVLYKPDGTVEGWPYWATDLARLVMVVDTNLVTNDTRFGVRIKPYYQEDELLRGYTCVYMSTYNITDDRLVSQTWSWVQMNKGGDRLVLQLPWNGNFCRPNGDLINRFRYPVSVAYEILPAKG